MKKGGCHLERIVKWSVYTIPKEVHIMATAFVIVSFAAVLVAKWNYYAKYSKNNK